MKDAYTFDKGLEGLDTSYGAMFQVYKRIFDRIGLDYKTVRAFSGAMGGLLSEEFQAITDIGEDIVVLCENCDLATNIEICACTSKSKKNTSALKEKKLLHTPNCGTIQDLYDNMVFCQKIPVRL